MSRIFQFPVLALGHDILSALKDGVSPFLWLENSVAVADGLGAPFTWPLYS